MATVSELLELARRQIGVKECPPNSNNVRYNTWYLRPGGQRSGVPLVYGVRPVGV